MSGNDSHSRPPPSSPATASASARSRSRRASSGQDNIVASSLIQVHDALGAMMQRFDILQQRVERLDDWRQHQQQQQQAQPPPPSITPMPGHLLYGPPMGVPIHGTALTQPPPPPPPPLHGPPPTPSAPPFVTTSRPGRAPPTMLPPHLQVPRQTAAALAAPRLSYTSTPLRSAPSSTPQAAASPTPRAVASPAPRSVAPPASTTASPFTPPPAPSTTTVAAPVASTSTPLPHASASPGASSSPPAQTSTPPTVAAFRLLSRDDKNTFRRILGEMGITVRGLVRIADEDDSTSSSSASPTSSSSTPTALPATPSSGPSAPEATTAAPTVTASPPTHGVGFSAAVKKDNDDVATSSAIGSTPNSSRTLTCKQEFLGTFSGDPARLEAFLSRVRDVLRSDSSPAWEAAVVRALSIAMTDDAAVWHEGLSDEEAKKLATFEGWATAMREAFPINTSKQRREARERKWNPAKESAAAYYFHKLRELRQAFGNDQSDETLVTEIKDGLPATMIHLLHLPRDRPTLQDLRKELGECEPTWEAMYAHTATEPASIPASTVARASHPAMARVATPSMARSASAPTLPGPRANPAATLPTKTGVSSLAATYDPSRVTPAANGRPRTYKRPDRDTIMTLDRPCTKCGGDHFNFEHDHVVPQVRLLADAGDDDYPEEDVAVGAEDDQGF